MLDLIVNVSIAFISMVAYGYVEKTLNIDGSGAFVALALCTYLVSRRGGMQTFIAPLLVSAQMYVLNPFHKPDLIILSQAQASLVLFLLLVVQLFVSRAKNLDGSSAHDEANIHQRPYEKELRSLLLNHDPSKLSKVDSMLDNNRGHEEDLLKKLKKQYGITSNDYDYRGSPTNRGTDWDTDVTLWQNEIKSFLQTNAPEMMRHLPSLLKRHLGNEEELLKSLYKEYNLEYIPPAHTRKWGSGATPVRHSPQPSSSPFNTRGESILEQAREEARKSINANIRRRYN